MSTPLVLPFSAITPDQFGLVGGKGANLGALTHMGVSVPDGFCVTTAAFEAFVDGDALHAAHIAELGELATGDLRGAARIGGAIRTHLEQRPVPEAVAAAVREALAARDTVPAWAVRSSATAEDLPGASFAGQQDTYLNVVGVDAILDRVRACWASLYTDRAILYRLEQGIPHADVTLCAVVQEMVQPISAGILFTADPVSGHRRVMAIDAGFGLGEAFVSGTVSADLIRVHRDTGAIVEQTIARKSHAIRSLPGGGTETVALPEDEQERPALSEADIRALVAAGETIEAAQGSPQDIEWCFDSRGLHIVQARPITSLYPVPTATGPNPLWFCFNHFQVMTDAVPPLGLDFWRYLLPFGRPLRGSPTPSPWAQAAAGRLYLDLSRMLRFAPSRALLLVALRNVDTLARDAVLGVLKRPEFARGPRISPLSVARFVVPRAVTMQRYLWFAPPEEVLEERNEWMRGVVESTVAAMSDGDLRARLARARIAVSDLFAQLFELPPRIFPGVAASSVLRKLLPDHGDDIDALGRGMTGNVTVEMDLDAGDLADVARGLPAVRAALLAREPWDQADGAATFREALDRFLAKWGARAMSEIDIARPRWREDPTPLLAVVAGNLAAGTQKGGHREHHAQLAARAVEAIPRLLKAAGRGPLGLLRRPLVRRMIRLVRSLAPMREHPKWAIVQIADAVRRLALDAGAALTDAGRLARPDDVFFLQWEELEGALASDDDLRAVVAERRADHVRAQALYPPRVMTGDGEVPKGEHTQEVPEGALAGTPASSGVVTGIARVIRDPMTEVLQKGEILVAPFTDPGWTPLFINAAGLVMEVGGLMTHGSVVAREYGIPAVVCVPDATRQIQTGQRIELHGTKGWVRVLDDPLPAPDPPAAAKGDETPQTHPTGATA